MDKLLSLVYPDLLAAEVGYDHPEQRQYCQFLALLVVTEGKFSPLAHQGRVAGADLEMGEEMLRDLGLDEDPALFKGEQGFLKFSVRLENDAAQHQG